MFLIIGIAETNKSIIFAGSRESRGSRESASIEVLSAPSSPSEQNQTNSSQIGRNPLRGSKCNNYQNFNSSDLILVFRTKICLVLFFCWYIFFAFPLFFGTFGFCFNFCYIAVDQLLVQIFLPNEMYLLLPLQFELCIFSLSLYLMSILSENQKCNNMYYLDIYYISLSHYLFSLGVWLNNIVCCLPISLLYLWCAQHRHITNQ